MTYFLDFDRTLFDTDPFKEYLQERLGVVGATEAEFYAKLTEALKSSESMFARGELEKFIYPDAREFLEARAQKTVIVTYGNPDLQRAKIESALATLQVDALYVGAVRKGEFMRDRVSSYVGPYAFVDDTVVELENMKTHCPDIPCFEMRRDGEAGDGRFPVIRSLAELP